MINFHVEPLILVWDDFERLANLHWSETEIYRHDQKLDIDKERYISYNEAGYHVLYTARNEDGEMVGYSGMYVAVSMHTKKKIATEDTIFLMKEYRGKGDGLAFAKFIQDHLVDYFKVTEIIQTTKHANKSASRTLAALGFESIGEVHAKKFKENY